MCSVRKTVAGVRMTAPWNTRNDHYDREVFDAKLVIVGVREHSQTQLKGRVSKWVRLSKFPRELEHEYQQRVLSDKENIKKYRSHLLVAKRFDTSGARLVALTSCKKSIGYGWMPVLGEKPITL